MKMLDQSKARDTLENILNRKEYRVYQNDIKGLIETWWERAKEWVADQLAKLFPTMESASSASGPVLIGIIVVVVLFLLIFTFFMVRNIRRNRTFREKKPLRSLKEMNWSYQKHIEEAKKQEELGEYTLSTRHLFLALLLFLHDKEWLEARIWKTNWEYYEELRKIQQQRADQFFLLANFFDEVTYGERKVSKEEYSKFSKEINQWLAEHEVEHLGERR
jgi:NADH:ubiquinone oxidoreductase subunit 3 (subunit A)